MKRDKNDSYLINKNMQIYIFIIQIKMLKEKYIVSKKIKFSHYMNYYKVQKNMY